MLIWPDLRNGRTRRNRALVGPLALGLLVGGAVASPAQSELPPAEQYALRVEYLWWGPTPQGQIQKGLGNREGTLLDLQDDLAFESGKANTIRGAFRLGEAWKLRGGWSPLDFSGETFAPRPFAFGTLVARFGDQIITALRGNAFSVGLEWDFLRRPEGFLGALVGVKYFDVDNLMVNVDTTSRVAETWKLPIPVLGLAGRVYIGEWVSLEGELSGITAGSRGHLWEWLLGMRIHPTSNVAVTGGYDRLTLEGRDDRDFFNLRLGAWTFGVEISL